MSSTYTILNNKRVTPYNTRSGNKESLIWEPRSTPSSTLFSAISNSLVLIRTCYPTQASNARIHQLDDSIELEVSTLASSTIVETFEVLTTSMYVL